MLYAFLLGITLLVVAMLVSRWALSAPPRQVLRAVSWVGFVIAVGGFLALLITQKLGYALALLAGLIPWGLKLLNLYLLARMLRGVLGGGGLGGLGGRWGGGATPGRSSSVTSRFLDMTLDHDTGTLSGRVTRGAFAGRDLDSLSQEEAAALWREAAGDADTLRLLEAWLDRTHPDWRGTAESETEDAAPASGTGSMGRDEARQILGLEPGASEAEIIAAHRRLITKMHPDAGGSAYLAAKLNQARDVLLGKR